MKILLVFIPVIIAIFFFGKRIFHSAKKNLFKDQTAWSGKDIQIKYSDSREVTNSEGNKNYLKVIADESEVFLEEQYKRENEESK